MNGVTHSLLQVVRHLSRSGHETLLVTPAAAAAAGTEADPSFHTAELRELRSVGIPSYPQVRLAPVPVRWIEPALRDFRPDVVHLASPFLTGWQALRAAERLGIPSVAVYQTDVPGYAQRYRVGAATAGLSQHLGRLHRKATLTLAPSSASLDELAALGVRRLRRWARGVDAERFSPARRSASWRAEHAPGGEVVIGYLGRLAPEKQLEHLRAVHGIPGTRLVIVGDGPERPALERLLPEARFLGFQSGAALAESLAGFDVFVHPGEHETFGQTIQEALASGVPVVATGRGGPLDLVESSRTGWLYRPGDLDDLRARVMDLAGDAAKRRAFSVAAREAVARRSWSAIGDELLGHYREAISLHAAASAGAPHRVPVQVGPAPETAPMPVAAPVWKRYVALGDSLTEGLCDTSRQDAGEYRGWADRLAMILAHRGPGSEALGFANLAVRSRTIPLLVEEQLPRAIALGADLVTVFIGGNDLARAGARPDRLAARLAAAIARLRATGAHVLVVTPVIPPWPFLRALHERTRVFALELHRVCREQGAQLLDLTEDPAFLETRMWADDRVHLSSHGHRLLSYRAAAALGVPGAAELGALDDAIHDGDVDPIEPQLTLPAWMWTHVRPWAGRRIRGRTAGDGRVAKHDALVPVGPADGAQRSPVRQR